MNTAVLGLDRIGRSTSIKGNSRFVLQNLGAVAQLDITPWTSKANKEEEKKANQALKEPREDSMQK